MNEDARSRRSAGEVYGRAVLPLPTGAEAAAADRAARERFGVPERVLMESAGRAAALVLQRLYPSGRIVGAAGSGNNGGDLAVMLRVLREWGRDATLIVAGSRPPDPELFHGAEVPAIDADADDAVARALAGADVIVDGLLGTGSKGEPRGRIAAMIERINGAGRPVFALDLPTGTDADTGRVAGTALRARETVTFGWPKLGLLLHPARRYCGRIIAVEIGFPPDAVAGVRTFAVTSTYVRERLRPRMPDAHKGSAGRVLVLAGSRGMAGAAALAAEAAGRAGAGLVRIASDAANRTVVQTLVPEATFLDRDLVTVADLDPMHALIAGPGMGTDKAAGAALERVLDAMPNRPALLDADALNLLATRQDGLAARAATRPLVITPHVAELSRLTGRNVGDIVADSPAAARAAAEAFGCTVLLKGQPSLVAEPDGTLYVGTAGSSDLATAGMGDQLAGVIGALLAAGHDPSEAARLGLQLSGRAADIAALGRSLSPRDVSRSLALAIADPGPVASPLDLPFVTFDQPARW